jgi:hypothetical protein
MGAILRPEFAEPARRLVPEAGQAGRGAVKTRPEQQSVELLVEHVSDRSRQLVHVGPQLPLPLRKSTVPAQQPTEGLGQGFFRRTSRSGFKTLCRADPR